MLHHTTTNKMFNECVALSNCMRIAIKIGYIQYNAVSKGKYFNQPISIALCINENCIDLVKCNFSVVRVLIIKLYKICVRECPLPHWNIYTYLYALFSKNSIRVIPFCKIANYATQVIIPQMWNLLCLIVYIFL